MLFSDYETEEEGTRMSSKVEDLKQEIKSHGTPSIRKAKNMRD
jgi:uncharacterized protein with PhoU and TrkA domain